MERPIVFTDFHHASLLNSLIILFEERLGGELYRPIGRDWYDKGYWKVYEHPATVAQFLDIGGATPDGTQPVNEITGKVSDNDLRDPIYLCQDIDSGSYNKAITYRNFMKMPFNIVIATIPQHIEPFKKLCEVHPNKPKLIFQIGNAWTVEAGLAPNIMASAIINDVPSDINFISYHQEFSLWLFKYSEPVKTKNIYSFVNMFNIADHFKPDYELFTKVEQRLPDWNFKVYGGQCRDGAMHGSKELSTAIKNSRFVWHTKNHGDGYGHIIHNVPAMGRPLIVKKEYYRNKLAEPLLIDGETCIVIDGLGIDEIVNKIEYYNDDEKYKQLSFGAYENFCRVVDFNKEAKLLTNFIENLK